MDNEGKLHINIYEATRLFLNGLLGREGLEQAVQQFEKFHNPSRCEHIEPNKASAACSHLANCHCRTLGRCIESSRYRCNYCKSISDISIVALDCTHTLACDKCSIKHLFTTIRRLAKQIGFCEEPTCDNLADLSGYCRKHFALEHGVYL